MEANNSNSNVPTEPPSPAAIALGNIAKHLIEDLITFCFVSWMIQSAWNGVVPFLSRHVISTITFGHAGQLMILAWGVGKMFGMGLGASVTDEQRRLPTNSRPPT